VLQAAADAQLDRHRPLGRLLAVPVRAAETRGHGDTGGSGAQCPYGALVEEQSKGPRFYYRKQLDRFLKSRLTLKDGSHGKSAMRDESRIPLIILMTATALVLLIAMANAANLLLARSAQRRRELAIRAAMGAGRGELMAQLLTEALLLALGGGLAGLLFGVATLRLLIAQLADSDTPIYFLTSQLDQPLLLFGLGCHWLRGCCSGYTRHGRRPGFHRLSRSKTNPDNPPEPAARRMCARRWCAPKS